jgi:hypothetical protein
VHAAWQRARGESIDDDFEAIEPRRRAILEPLLERVRRSQVEIPVTLSLPALVTALRDSRSGP